MRISGYFLHIFVLASGLLAIVCAPVFAIETVTLGEDGELDWRGEGSSAVETIDAEYLAPLDPNNPGPLPNCSPAMHPVISSNSTAPIFPVVSFPCA